MTQKTPVKLAAISSSIRRKRYMRRMRAYSSLEQSGKRLKRTTEREGEEVVELGQKRERERKENVNDRLE